MCGFSNVLLFACMGFVMCGCFNNCMGVLVICALVFTVFLYFSFIFILICYHCKVYRRVKTQLE